MEIPAFGVQTTAWSFRLLKFNRRTSVVDRVQAEEDQNNAASSHLPLHTALRGACTSSALEPVMGPGDEFLVGPGQGDGR